MTEKTRLCEHASTTSSILTVLLLLGNVGLQIYSHIGISAYILSSVDPEASAPSGPPAQVGVDVCTAPDETAWDAQGQAVYQEMAYCLTQPPFECAMNNDAKCVGGCMTSLRGYTEDCASCFQGLADCTMSQCFAQCGTGFDQACAVCVQTTCSAAFDTCTGFATKLGQVGGRRRADKDDPPAPKLHEVYTISFVSSVKDCFENDAWVLGVVIVVFSGIWPYMKNLIMATAWFVPMSESARGTMLKWLNIFARFSMLDVFVVIFLMVGIQMDTMLGSTRVIVVVESQTAIWTFAIAALWDLAQGEFMRHRHEALVKKTAGVKDFTLTRTTSGGFQAGTKGPGFEETETKRTLSPCCSLLSAVLATFVAVGAFFSLTLYFARYETEGFVIEGTTDYSAWGMAKNLLSGTAHGLVSTPGGHTFLAVIMIVFVGAVPILNYCTLPVAFLLSKKNWVLTITNVLGGFACLDVFVLAGAIAFLEWKNVTKPVADRFATLPCGEDCIKMSGGLDGGIWVMIATVVVGYFVQMLRDPNPKPMCCLKMFGCTTEEEQDTKLDGDLETNTTNLGVAKTMVESNVEMA